MFITGVPSYGLYPCLYSNVPTGLFVWVMIGMENWAMEKKDGPADRGQVRHG